MDNALLHYAAPQKYIFNWSLEKGTFPKVWKHAKLCPIPKDSKEPITPANSQPISLLPSLSKTTSKQALQVDLGDIREWDNDHDKQFQITHLRKKKKAQKNAYMIRRIAKYLPGKILKQTTQSLIGSQVNYCSVVWGNASASEIRRLQIAQNKAAMIILRWRYDSSVVVMHNALGWSSNQQDN
ncbi:unnamed protein product [Coregonus sp. 'balchen']|nr:unnamed protein product [Coregonus sp. 'balchen']